MKSHDIRHAIAVVTIKMNLWSQEAEDLLVGTAAHESGGFKHIKQIKGPALGLFQMEPATLTDIYDSFLQFRAPMREKLDRFKIQALSIEENLWFNIPYQIAAARIHYYRRKPPIPTTIEGQAKYWKDHYNTIQGKGTIEKYLEDYQRYCKSNE